LPLSIKDHHPHLAYRSHTSLVRKLLLKKSKGKFLGTGSDTSFDESEEENSSGSEIGTSTPTGNWFKFSS